MNVMFPEAFTAEYEELMALLTGTAYMVIMVVGEEWYMVDEEQYTFQTDAWHHMYDLEERHPEHAYLTVTLDEYTDRIQNGPWG